ncbi:hypothetical protein GOV07_01430 [Candidatus Woesearchaeota archaeon]|nr:hypothetical protein [Candidatus Woesearchaeota archaeon]
MVMRRGVLFSLISILLSTFFIILFWSGNSARLDTTLDAVETRISVMSNYVSAFDTYVADSARLSTRAALVAITNDLALNGMQTDTVTNMKSNITTCLLTGFTRLNETDSIACSGKEGDSFINRVNNFTYIGQEELGISTEYEIAGNRIGVRDLAPFELEINFTMNYVVNDSFSRWNRSEIHRITVSVIGLPDPLFTRYAQFNIMDAEDRRRNLTSFPVLRELFKAKNVSDLIASQAYVSNRDMAPTYLERLAGNMTGDLDPTNSSGIETLIDPNITSFIPGDAPLNMSYTAYQLFSKQRFKCGNETYGINVTDFNYPTFRLDVAHLVRYNVTDINDYNMTCS